MKSILMMTKHVMNFFAKKSEVQRILSELKSANPDQADLLINQLNEIVKCGISLDDAKAIILSSANSYPERRFDFQKTNVDVLRALRNYDCHLLIDDLLQLARYSDGAVNKEITFLLSFVESEAAVNAIFSILELPEGSRPEQLNLSGWKDKKIEPSNVFPRILDFGTEKAYFYEIGLTILSYGNNFDLAENKAYIEFLISFYNDMNDSEQKLNIDKNIANWFYNDEYLEIRSNKGLILDILGLAPLDQTVQFLQMNLESKDPRIVHFAISSLLNHNIDVDNKYIKFVAEDNEMRKWIFSLMKEKKLDHLLDSSDFCQTKLAISDMVNWLVFPTELATAPSQIELLKKVSMDTNSENGIIDYYIFKFKTDVPHWAAEDGWLVGISGPFLAKECPSVDSYGETFSSFEKYDEREPEEYLGNIHEILEKWKD